MGRKLIVAGLLMQAIGIAMMLAAIVMKGIP